MRYLVIGVLAFLAVLIALLPASLLRHLTGDFSELLVVTPRGTLYDGTAHLVVAGERLGNLSWSFAPDALLPARIAVDYHLEGEGMDIGGRFARGLRDARVHATGALSMARLAPILEPYDLMIGGKADLRDVEVGFDGTQPVSARGSIVWSGGEVRYVLSGRPGRAVLEPMAAELAKGSGGPVAMVRSAGRISGKNVNHATPLIEVTLGYDGFVRVGVTKALTNMLNSPWPGNDPDQAIVLQVEEQIFSYQ
ncbi:MAG: type II secretion system protein N [Pseudomonadales bacterium]|jgi:hypothetical protein|nr:type II secretion system protein N [Pseudomonadales bacterium]MDP6471694.1 type II secretion system protein N [Pseudomonadales bacterium]MDP6972208.1 type II secretion system protein N [Pseudomonadales bacterium]|tara:strand:- start:665 stop:1417 length:753 start_codon:yes stop_codon:yes gene_type:complete